MTVQFKNNFFEGEKWLEAGAEAHSLYVLACDYADRKETNGIVPRAMLARLALSTPESVVESTERLVRLGFFRPAHRGNSVEITAYLSENIGQSAEDKAEIRAKWAADKRRRGLHANGVHTECNPRYCKQASENSTGGGKRGISGGSTKESKGGSTPIQYNSSHSDSLRSNEEEGDELKVGGENEVQGARSTGSAGAPPVAGLWAGVEDGATVYPGTAVQLVDLPADQVNPNQPQLRVEADGDGDRVYVATPADNLGAPVESLAADFVRRANRQAAAAMVGYGQFQDDGSGPSDPAWILTSADPETLFQYAKTFHTELPWGE